MNEPNPTTTRTFDTAAMKRSPVAAGALAGTGMSHTTDPGAEGAYRSESYFSHAHAGGSDDGVYRPAHGRAIDTLARLPRSGNDEGAPAFERDWNASRGPSRLGVDSARHAPRDAGQRVNHTVERAAPGASGLDDQ